MIKAKPITEKDKELIKEYRKAINDNTADEAQVLCVNLYDVIKDITEKTVDAIKALQVYDSALGKHINL